MKRITLACAALVGAVLMFASLASAAKPADHQGGGKSAAAKQCAAEKKADKAAFKEKYGKHAMRDCIKGATGSGDDEAKNAAKECKAERAEDPAAFALAYGSNENGKNALGKCVSSKVDDDEEVEGEDPSVPLA